MPVAACVVNATRMAFDLCIVGAGMIGSSAARHATLLGQSVCLIGPTEPKERQGHEIFSAHYDEGRITRSTAFDTTWAVLSTRSITRYRQIEKETGINFYHEVGCLTVGDADSEFLQRSYSSAKKQNLQDVDYLTDSETETRFPYLSLCNPHAHGFFEPKNAGYINPRLMIAAQQKLAQNGGGCRIIREIVNSVVTENPGLSKVTTDQGTEVLARKVLVATGAFTDFRPILPRHLQLRLQPVTQAVIFAELSAEDQQIMKNMPSMLIRQPTDNQGLGGWPKSDTEGREEDYDCYILPPIKYPNGKVYLKLGHGGCLEKPLNSPKEITDWFLSSVPGNWQNDLKELLKSRFPDIKPVSFHFDTCATVDTPTGRPYIDLVGTNLGVALGDNGCSAKSCDEIGRLAALLIVKGRWEDDLPKEAFKMILKSAGDSKL